MQPRQILRSDATIRVLYETSHEHAFQEIWEDWLHRRPEDLQNLGRSVLGGGLRFVMPPPEGNPDEAFIEVKVESFLPDTRKIFVETQFVWQMRNPQNARFDCSNRLEEVNKYLTEKLVPLVTGGTS